MTEKQPIKSIEWQITSRCNYRCEYCFQSKENTSDCSDDVVDKVLEFTGSLGESWFIKLIGGEPFACKRFFEICEKLISQKHTLALTTNFSYPKSDFEKLIDITGEKLTNITASLHLTQIKDIDEFIENCGWFERYKSEKTNFAVTSVLTEENFEHLKKIEQRLSKAGVQFRYQRIKLSGKYCDYSEEIEDYIADKLISNSENTFHFNSFGTKCYTGLYFFRILLNGNVVRCYNSQPIYKLGNIAANTFRPFKKVMPCGSKECTCTTPANRNMIIWGQKSSFLTTVIKTLPEYIIRKLR